MDSQQLIEKLSYQVDSFQEGFKILSEARTFEDLAKSFCHILRGSLMVSYVNLYYKSSENDPFLTIHEQNKTSHPNFEDYEIKTSFTLQQNDDSKILLAFLPRHDTSCFAILCGPKLDQETSAEHERISIQLFAQLLDNAYQSLLMRKSEKDLIFTLNNRILQMNNLIDTGIELSKSENEAILLSLSLERAVGMTNASGGQMVVKEGNRIKSRIKFPPTFDINGKADKKKPDYAIDSEFKFQGIKFSVTLYEKESRRGLIPFEETDSLLLNALTRQVQAAIENDYLQKQSLEMETVKKELAIAATIQQRILPESLPEIPGYEVAGKNIPAIEVCGDYYDVIQVDDHKYALIMADVSGKGIPAALLVSTLQASLRVYLESNPDLTFLNDRLNKLIYQSTTSEKYLTMSMCYLDIKTGDIDFVNAGHNPPLIAHNDQSLTKVITGGIPIGMADLGLSYDKKKYKIDHGEGILMFTDGITEAMDIDEEMYEDERLDEFLIKNRSLPANQFIDLLIDDVEKFVGTAPQSDDITALYVKRL